MISRSKSDFFPIFQWLRSASPYVHATPPWYNSKIFHSFGQTLLEPLSSSITSFHNNDPTADISQEPPNEGVVIVGTCLFVGIVCLTFFELMSMAYLDFLEYAMTKDEDSMFTLQGDTDSSCATFQDIMRDCKNSEVMWLENDESLNVIKENENQSNTTQD